MFDDVSDIVSDIASILSGDSDNEEDDASMKSLQDLPQKLDSLDIHNEMEALPDAIKLQVQDLSRQLSRDEKEGGGEPKIKLHKKNMKKLMVLLADQAQRNVDTRKPSMTTNAPRRYSH